MRIRKSVQQTSEVKIKALKNYAIKTKIFCAFCKEMGTKHFLL